MSKISLINDYLDGALSFDEEKHLFSELQSDDELRRSLKQLIEIRTTLRNKFLNVQPSASVRNKVFAGAGFAAAGTLAFDTVEI